MDKKKLHCVMLIDDDEPTNFLNKMVLEEAECTEHIVVKDSAMDALKYLKNKDAADFHLPDLIFLDINMPAMNGWEFLEEYKELPISHIDQPILLIMLTTSLNPDDEELAESYDSVTGFKNKPFTLELLEEIMAEYF